MTDEINSGFIKLFRRMKKWQWYKNSKTKSLFIHCLLCASHKKREWNGIQYGPGQFVTSIRRLADETGLTVREVRTALKHLEATQEVTHKTTHHPHPKYALITVSNWSLYQKATQETTQKTANIQEDKEGRGGSNEPSPPEKDDDGYWVS